MSWDERFSHQYDAWSAHVTDDIEFYVGLARQSDGPLVELAVGIHAATLIKASRVDLAD
jgi:hypothetical protein